MKYQISNRKLPELKKNWKLLKLRFSWLRLQLYLFIYLLLLLPWICGIFHQKETTFTSKVLVNFGMIHFLSFPLWWRKRSPGEVGVDVSKKKLQLFTFWRNRKKKSFASKDNHRKRESHERRHSNSSGKSHCFKLSAIVLCYFVNNVSTLFSYFYHKTVNVDLKMIL